MIGDTRLLADMMYVVFPTVDHKIGCCSVITEVYLAVRLLADMTCM